MVENADIGNTYLEAIRLDPTDEVAWLVYTDWLKQEGGPRSEVLSILDTVGFPSNLIYYPPLKARMEELREPVSADWFDLICQLREGLNQSANPGPADVERLWRELAITVIRDRSEPQAAALAELITASARYLTVPALIGRFSLAAHPVLKWYGSRDRWRELQLLPQFIRTPAVRASLGLDYQAGRTPWTDLLPEDCDYGSAASLAGKIASGDWGPYTPKTGPRASAFRKALERFCAEFFGSNVGDLHAGHTDVAWAPWFEDDDADHTWLVINSASWEVTLLCFTSFEP